MEDRRDKQDAQRILLIKETLASAEKNLQTAKSILAQLEVNYIPQKKTYGVAEGGKIIEGTFDGQLMIGTDGRQYPVPANYASKSKLVEGDMLKLVITDDGNFIYKQIGPFKRKRVIGILKESTEEGGYVVEAEGKVYRVLLAAVTYHHASSGDEVALVVADNDEAKWGAIENVTRKGVGNVDGSYSLESDMRGELEENQVDSEEPAVLAESETEKPAPEKKEKKKSSKSDSQPDLDEELTPDLAEMEEELKRQTSKE